MSNKKITDLASYSASQVNPYDLLFITDIDHQETKNITATELAAYGDLIYGASYKTGSFSGSFYGTASYVSTTANLNYPNNSTASLAISASYSDNSISSSYALTSSYALNGGTGVSTTNFKETITVNYPHGFSIGDAVFQTGTNRNYYQAISVWTGPDNIANEVIGVIQSTSSAYTFTVVYGGIIDFGLDIPSYFQSQNGYAYFLSGSEGKLSLTDPTTQDSANHISKPVLLKVDSASAYIINQRGLYVASGNTVQSASYSLTSSYSNTASYALNGGGGGGPVTNAYYIDTIPIGTIITCASSSAPAGYLPCDGTYYAISSFKELYDRINQDINNNQIVKFGVASEYQASSNSYVPNPAGKYFNVPDLRGIFIRGYNDGLVNINGNLGGIISPYDSGSGRKFGTLQTSAIPKHEHGFGTYVNNNGKFVSTNDSRKYDASNAPNSTTWNGNGNGTPNDGSSLGSNATLNLITTLERTGSNSDNRPVNLVLNYYIKAKQINLDNATLQSVANGTYPINGDVIGSINQNTVTRIQNVPVSSGTPTVGSILQYDGSVWSPAEANLTTCIYIGYTSNGGGSTPTVHMQKQRGTLTITCSRTGTGRYTFLHNIGNTNYFVTGHCKDSPNRKVGSIAINANNFTLDTADDSSYNDANVWFQIWAF